ncbi:MAG: toll/interleukin-1 receptor domain-containing protein [Acetatifactor sp.]|nr:toll/interleukin-1 receptor domain-containing protein [Acetatifactor sp.]
MMKCRYDAFISYRHTELDKFAAENLHRQMEAFRLPGKLSDRREGRTRITRVFRDRDELPMTNDLEENIMEALQESEYLVVICSPRLRESLWCRIPTVPPGSCAGSWSPWRRTSEAGRSGIC